MFQSMKTTSLKGVIGVVANDSLELEFAKQNKLYCIEIRADLLIDKGFSIDEICELVKDSRLKNLFCLFTLRHQDHGGKFFGTEKERIKIYKLAMEWSATAHQALGCRGISRSDLRYDESKNQLIMLEVNTQPGMTSLSLVPEQANHVGISFPELVSWLVENAQCD